jgi:hypothetical protein
MLSWGDEERQPGASRLKDRSMPPFVAFAGALGGLAVMRWAYKTAVRINRELQDIRLERISEEPETREFPTLRRDPVTGAYRPSTSI